MLFAYMQIYVDMHLCLYYMTFCHLCTGDIYICHDLSTQLCKQRLLDGVVSEDRSLYISMEVMY